MRKELFFCDVCLKEVPITVEKLQVVFDGSQDEGFPDNPHLSNEIIDICRACMSKRLKGNGLCGVRKHGRNEYYFKVPEKETELWIKNQFIKRH